LVFITDRKCASCAVETEFLTIIRDNLRLLRVRLFLVRDLARKRRNESKVRSCNEKEEDGISETRKTHRNIKKYIR
jgi:hypothetical protein